MAQGQNTPLLTLALGGMQTITPAGLQPQDNSPVNPRNVMNGYLDRVGGLHPQYASSLLAANVSRATWAGIGADLFVEPVSGSIKYYTAATKTVSAISGSPGTSLTGAKLLMPGLLLSNAGGTYVTKDGIYNQADNLDPSAFTFTYTGPPNPGTATGFDSTVVYDVLIVAQPQKDFFFQTSLQGSCIIAVGPGHTDDTSPSGPPAGSFGFRVNYLSGTNASFAVYWRRYGSNQDWTFGGESSQYPTQGKCISRIIYQAQDPAYPAIPQWPTYLRFNVGVNTPAAYHQARCWVAATSAKVFDATSPSGLQTNSYTNRLYYSEPIAQANIGNLPGTKLTLPQFSADNYIDVPFTCSNRIIAIVENGAYLYIFGDREVFSLRGNSDTDFQLELLANSMGAIAAQSIQKIGTELYWLSDSGVMATKPAYFTQFDDVSKPIYPNIAPLDPNRVSSAADFSREIYWICDDSAMFGYHIAEQGWVQRDDGVPLTVDIHRFLVPGGGVPYYVANNGLYGISGERDVNNNVPPYLAMTVDWGRLFGQTWHLEKQWTGMHLGASEISGTFNVTLNLESSGFPKSIAKSLTSAGRVSAGFPSSGVDLAVSLTTAAGVSSGVLVGPVYVLGNVKAEAK